jgi:DNA-binding transcriptional MerR regulator/effector-binding domain-containing protein
MSMGRMYGIGEFASIGRVSVRMLRHYDEIGLLAPARVDPFTGYRSYAAEQLATLGRIVELRALGLRLDDITRVVCGQADDAELRRLLEVARLEAEHRMVEDTARLARIDAHLRASAGGSDMSTTTIISPEVRAIDPLTVAVRSARAPGWGPAIGPVVGPLFGEVFGTLSAAGLGDAGPAVGVYQADESGDESGVLVTAGFVVPEGTAAIEGLEVRTLPALAQAAVAVHRGDMEHIHETWEALVAWIRAHGFELSGACREVYWTPGDRPQSEWVTDLVQPVTRPEA